MASCCNKVFHHESRPSNTVSNHIAICPPSKPTYTIEERRDSEYYGTCYKQIKFTHKDYNEINYPWIKVEAYKAKKYTNKNKLIILYFKTANIIQPNRTTIIFSHGNTTDLGVIYPFLMDLVSQLKV